jgi:hypothetical protein
VDRGVGLPCARVTRTVDSVDRRRAATAQARRTALADRLLLYTPRLYSQQPYISLLQRTLSRRCRSRGNELADDVDLGTPTLVLHSAAHSQLLPLVLIRARNHTDHTATASFPHLERPVKIMAEDPVPIEDVAVTSVDFRAVAMSTGNALRRRLQEDSDFAIKNDGFDFYKMKRYEKDLKKLTKLFRETVCGTGPARRKNFTLTSST